MKTSPTSPPPRSHEALLALILLGIGAVATAAQADLSTAEPAAAVWPGPGAIVLSLAGCGDKEGRPFTVAAEVRTTVPTARTDWRTDCSVDPSSLTPGCRSALAAHYLRIAAAEHASVASFHRFALELLHLGAPPELLLATHQAASDEVRHAQVAYGLACSFGAPPTGPAPLDVRGALDVDLRPAGVMQRLIDEACVGETISALRLRHIAAQVTDPALAGIIHGIAADEERHAALGWRTLRWLLEAHPELRTEAQSRLTEVTPPSTAAASVPAGLEAWGLLSVESRADIAQQALERVIQPAAAALGHGPSAAG
ncbi:MAG: hypothetical protein ACI8RZ_002916 [Myxococcota bacterium]|jgi:hypothetical protein